MSDERECTCGGTDIGVGIEHEHHCLLHYMHCTRCGGKGRVPCGGDGSREQRTCPRCFGTGVRPTRDWGQSSGR